MNSPTTNPKPPSAIDPTLVEDLMAQYFPPCHPEDHEWINIHDGASANREVVREMLAHLSQGAAVFVSTEDDVVGLFTASQAEEIIASYVLRSQVRVANRQFTQLMFIELNGVATVWHLSEGLAGASSEA